MRRHWSWLCHCTHLLKPGDRMNQEGLDLTQPLCSGGIQKHWWFHIYYTSSNGCWHSAVSSRERVRRQKASGVCPGRKTALSVHHVHHLQEAQHTLAWSTENKQHHIISSFLKTSNTPHSALLWECRLLVSWDPALIFLVLCCDGFFSYHHKYSNHLWISIL